MSRSGVRAHRHSSFPRHALPLPPAAGRQTHFQESRHWSLFSRQPDGTPHSFSHTCADERCTGSLFPPAARRVQRVEQPGLCVSAILLLADEPNVIHLVVCHGESRHAGASSKQASETQRRHTSARSRNERARGVLFASKPTRRCGSSAEAAMAAIKRPRETRNGRFWMLIELKKSCIGESDAGNQTPHTATKPRNARKRTI